ncbi:putative disheveled-associated activator of morphogenesis 1 isoform X4 [Penaeus vannamei]|uniref:Putative disheveled-associated activator of morphogenesis 1 isoform X4 n=1 Tax=Penaeus vannamei TaxID=6689 RepID=A0A423TAJ1_PENVA|nr:putative disheveled-associated activator of morphogenesis 1 isoform X4 [Penaeus vannamei]
MSYSALPENPKTQSKGALPEPTVPPPPVCLPSPPGECPLPPPLSPSLLPLENAPLPPPLSPSLPPAECFHSLPSPPPLPSRAPLSLLSPPSVCLPSPPGECPLAPRPPPLSPSLLPLENAPLAPPPSPVPPFPPAECFSPCPPCLPPFPPAECFPPLPPPLAERPLAPPPSRAPPDPDQLRPDWSSIRRFPTDKLGGWPDLPRPDFSTLRRPSVNGLRSSLSDLRDSLHERVSSLGDWPNGGVPSSPPGDLRGASEVRGRDRSRGRGVATSQLKRAKMRRGEWYSSCFCFKGAEPPQIEHVVSEQPQMVQMAPPPNMENNMAPEELQTKVTELLDELDLTSTQKNGILNFPPEKQLQLLYDYHTLKSSNKKIERPEAYIAKLEEYSEMTVPTDQYQHHTWLKYTEGLKTALATQSNTFVNEFMEAGGLTALLQFLTKMEDTTFQSTIHTNVIACVKALMNNSNGRKHILAHPTCMNVISQSLTTENFRTKTMVLEILGGVCLLPGGHKKVLESMLHFQKFAGERTRFQTLIVDLDRSWGNFADELSLKIAIMSFINAIIRWGPGEDSLEFRLHLRYEFLMLGVQPVIEKLRALQNETLDNILGGSDLSARLGSGVSWPSRWKQWNSGDASWQRVPQPLLSAVCAHPLSYCFWFLLIITFLRLVTSFPHSSSSASLSSFPPSLAPSPSHLLLPPSSLTSSPSPSLLFFFCCCLAVVNIGPSQIFSSFSLISLVIALPPSSFSLLLPYSFSLAPFSLFSIPLSHTLYPFSIPFSSLPPLSSVLSFGSPLLFTLRPFPSLSLLSPSLSLSPSPASFPLYSFLFGSVCGASPPCVFGGFCSSLWWCPVVLGSSPFSPHSPLSLLPPSPLPSF